MKRSPRFRRVDQKNTPINLTVRDLEILDQVRHFRFLNSDQIALLVGGSKQGILRRLYLLFHHGYLDRPVSQQQFYQRGDNRPLAYSLTRHGFRTLQLAGVIPEDLTFSLKESGSIHLEHQLLKAEVMLAVQASCSDRMVFTSEQEIMKEHDLSQWFWEVEVTADETTATIPVVPDGVFALGNGTAKNHYLLEVDRGTMPVIRSNLTQSSIQRKLLAYNETFRQNHLESWLGITNPKLVIVTSSVQRKKRIQEHAMTLAMMTVCQVCLRQDLHQISGAVVGNSFSEG